MTRVTEIADTMEKRRANRGAIRVCADPDILAIRIRLAALYDDLIVALHAEASR